MTDAGRATEAGHGGAPEGGTPDAEPVPPAPTGKPTAKHRDKPARPKHAESPEPASLADRAADVASAIPRGVWVATAWSACVLTITAGAALLVFALVSVRVVAVPAFIAVLIAALIIPATDFLARIGLPRGLAAGLTLLGLLLVIGGALTLVGQQIVSGFEDLVDQLLEGIEQIREWLIEGPLNLSDSQLQDFIDTVVEQGTNFLENTGDQIATGVVGFAGTVTGVVAGFFLVLFALFFFLYDGQRIWSWLVRVFPRGAREQVDGAGRQAWQTLTSFVRATVLVALVDAIGIALIALVLRVPFWFPIGVLVFFGAFIPIVGAVISGVVAILVALVVHGIWVALAMTIGVLAVQQLESNILQPFLLGRSVRVHPIAVVLAVGAGIYLAGIVGALFAVPVVAVLNTVVNYLLHGQDRGHPSNAR